MSVLLAVVVTAAAAAWAAVVGAGRDRLARRRCLARFGGRPRWGSLGVGWAQALLGAVVRSRRRRAADRALPDWLDAAARHVRSGASLPHALAHASGAVGGTALGGDAAALARSIDAGGPFEATLDAFVAAAPSRARRLVVRALSLAWATGGAPAAVLDGVGATLRDRLALQGEARALATQARASAAVIATAPAAFALVGASADSRVAGFLVGSPVGVGCLLGGLALELAGAAWMVRLVQATGS